MLKALVHRQGYGRRVLKECYRTSVFASLIDGMFGEEM